MFANQAENVITDLSIYEIVPHYVKGYLHTMQLRVGKTIDDVEVQTPVTDYSKSVAVNDQGDVTLHLQLD